MGRPRKKKEEETQAETLEAVADAEAPEVVPAEEIDDAPTATADVVEPDDDAPDEPEAVAEPEPDSEPEPEAHVAEEVVDEEPTAEAGEEPEVEAEPELEPAAEADVEPEPAPEVEVEPEAEPGVEPAASEEVVEVVAEEGETERAGAVIDEAPAVEAPPAPPARTKRRSSLTRAEKKAKRAARPRPAPKPARERKPIVRLEKPVHARGQRKERRGVVVSSAMDKTIVVRVETLKPDRRYKKVVRRSSRFHAHDEGNVANVGDIVRIVETRPLSKTKNWRLAEVLEAAK